MSEENEVEDDDDGGMLAEEESGGMPVEEGAPLWMTTFGDLMSLLLTFFVLLFSMSELKVEKFAIAAQSFREATGGTAVIEAIDPQGLVIRDANPQLKAGQAGDTDTDDRLLPVSDPGVAESLAEEYLDAIAEQVREFVKENSLEETLLVTEGPSGVRIRISAGVLFAPGSGLLQEDAEWIIQFLADMSNDIDVPVIVAGHADNQPIRTAQFGSNWELSAYRAAGIARQMAESGIEGKNLRVESFGSAQPIESNDTAEGRAANRRVEFFYDRNDIVAEIQTWRSTVVEGRIPEGSDWEEPAGDEVPVPPDSVSGEGNPGGV